MTVRIGWDEYEVALLIDACNRIRDNKIDKAECVHKLSNSLRQRAKANGINIDEVFRNENGIALQMTKMEYLLTDGKKGLPGASKLYIEMAKMSKLNSDEFEKILILAKEQIGYKEAMNNMNTREKFIQWLSSNPISKYSSNTIVNALDEGSEYCCSRSLSKVSFWDMNNKNEFITVASKLLGMKIYRLMHKKTAIVLDKAVPLYKKFLQQSEKRSGIKIPDVEISTEGSGDNVEAKDNQSSDSKYSQIYQKLYYISKVYDDPNGMTLEKIMSMLGNGTDEELVISILNDVSWATKLADDIYSFGKNANSVLREQVQPYKIEEKDIVTDGQFFDFLYNYEKMAEASCRSYVSAIRTAEEYAKNHNYAGVVFLGNIKEENMDEYGYMLGELPTLFQETALLDRIHGFVKGWDIPRMNDGLKLTGWALNSEYFCSILHELRNDMSYRAIVEKIVEVPEHADTRDTEAIKRLATAYLKLLFPNVRNEFDVDKMEFRDYCLTPAMKMRRIIKLQQGMIDSEYKNKDIPCLMVRE